MRRGVLAICATAIGAGLMIGAKLGHPPADEQLSGEAVAQNQSVGDDGGAGDDGATPSAGPSGVPGPSGSATTKASPKPGPSRTGGAPAPSTSPKSSPTPAGQYKNGTYTGSSVTERYGAIQVTITVSGGKIASASATCTNPCSGESRSISTNAFNKLNPRVVTAQSANVSSVSGATFTSTAYKTSLAAAVDAAKA